MPGFTRTGLKKGFLGFLSDSDIEQIHAGALYVMQKTGLVIHDEGVLSILGKAGCRIEPDSRHAFFPPDLVEYSVRKAPSIVHLYDRLGQIAMSLGEGSFHARVSSGATGYIDPGTKARRDPTIEDAATIARLVDALPNIHGTSSMAAQPADVPVTTVDVHAVRVTLENSIKPLGYVCLNPPLIEPVIEMVAAAVGGEEILKKRPMITALAESTSPLQLVSSQMAVLRAFASRGLPLTLHAHPMAGFTAPVTLAGELVITHAEILAQVTIAQLIRAGTPVVYGMSSSVPDMRYGTNLSGAVEIGLLGAAVAQLARKCQLPCLMSTGTDAHVPGAQALMDRLMTLLPPAFGGIDLVNLTALGTKMTVNLVQLVIDDLLLGIVARCLSGLDAKPDSLALDLIQQVGPGGSFVTTEHTLSHFKGELMVPDLVAREPHASWEQSGSTNLIQRAEEKVRVLVEDYRPQPLSEDTLMRINEIERESVDRVGKG